MKREFLPSAAAILAMTLVIAACGGSASPGPSSVGSSAAASANAPKPAASAAVTSPAASTAPVTSGAPAGSASTAAQQTPLNPPVKIRVRSIGLSGEAGTFIALDRGYLKQEGLDIEFTTGLGTPEAITGLLSGSLDLSAGALDVSLLNALQRNVDMKILAPQTVTPSGDKNASIIVRKELVDGGVYKSPQDLKGKNIAIGSNEKTSAQLFVEKALAKGGLKASDVNLVPLNFPDELAALGGKKVDAGWEVEPLATAAEAQGLAVPVIWSGELFPNYDPFLIVESPKFAQSQPEALKRFAAAHLRGQRDFYNAFQKGGGNPDAQTAIFDVLAKYTTVKDPKTWQAVTAKGRMQSVDPNDAFHLSGFDELQDYFVRVGTLQTKIDVSKVIDTGPVDYALQRLGKV